MNADLAAGYCGEKHIEDFLERVGTVYPSPRVEDSIRRKFWYRDDLDRSLGLVPSESSMGARFREKVGKERRG